VAPDQSLIMSVGEGANHGELAAFRVLAHTPAPTALFCYDDMTALGALRALRALKMRVPADVSVVGYDDIPLAAYLDPPLTTVGQPMNEMGRQAMSVLLDVMRGDGEPRTIVLGGELVVRGSSGPAPA
jgi:DNA-binding LacI/PurR family transcriptional regulator